MKKCKLFCAAAIFSALLSVPALGGDIQTPTFAPPPPSTRPNSLTQPIDIPGDKTIDDAQEQTELSSDLLTELIFGLLALY
jgi:hypothetical protein